MNLVRNWKSADLHRLAAEINAESAARTASGQGAAAAEAHEDGGSTTPMEQPNSIMELARIVELRLAAMDQSQTPKVFLNGKLG